MTLNLIMGVVMLEVALQAFPSLVPESVLVYFHSTLRGDIATIRNLPTASSLTSLDRDDGGPPLVVFRPHATITYDFDDYPGLVNTVVMDANGFCNPPGAEAVTSDVLILGDSMGWCTTVEPRDTWAFQLGALTDLETYNLSSPFLGPFDYIQVLKRFGVGRAPRVVFMNIYEGNDLSSAVRHAAYDQNRGEARPPLVRAIRESPLGRESYAFNTLTALLMIGYRGVAAGRGEDQPNFRYSVRLGPRRYSFNPMNGDLDELAIAQAANAGRADFASLLPAIESLVSLGEREGFILIIVYTPTAYTVYSDQVAFEDPDHATTMAQFSATQRAFLTTALARLGIRFIDLTTSLQKAASASDRPIYFPANSHFTQEGHLIVANRIADELEELGVEWEM